MFFRCLSALMIAASMPCFAADASALRVCADPNNMPFSNEHGDGFENKLAELLAAKLGSKVEYTWWSQRKSFLKNSIGQGRCDVVMGVPTGIESVTTTKPYYRSTYVFVSRNDRDLHVASLLDPRLEKWRIGIHVVGDDYAPPAFALARRGITANVVSFSLFGQYGEPNPPSKIIDAVVNGDVDIAIVWGPFAGYFAKSTKTHLDIAPVSPAMFAGVPFAYDISLGVKQGNRALKAELESVLDGESAPIDRLLSDYGVPRAH